LTFKTLTSKNQGPAARAFNNVLGGGGGGGGEEGHVTHMGDMETHT
jgi:hypothetical protein